MKIIEVSDLSKSFGEVEALSDVGIEADKGEIIGVLGPNGAGKSTLVKILTGQLERDSGDVEVLGIDPGEEPVKLREEVGILPEREDPPSFLTGNEYLDFVSDVRGQGIEREKWIEKMNLEGKMENFTRDLSKGERQKLMMIQAFFHEPELVFIDEPLVNLDPLIQERSKELFREVRQRGGTLVLSTHVISLAEEVCDRVLFLKDGKVVDEVEKIENLKEKFLEQE